MSDFQPPDSSLRVGRDVDRATRADRWWPDRLARRHGVGAGVGAVTTKVVDLGIPDEWVGWFKQAVHDGTTAVVILVEHVHVGELAAEAARFQGAELLYTTLPPESITQLLEAFAAD